MTRKRRAPGSNPVVHPQVGAVPNLSSANPGSQLSNDQFLQWGQNPSANVINASFPDPAASYNTSTYPTTQDMSAPTATPSNQLARREAPNQLVSRNRGYEQAPVAYGDHGGNTSTGESGAWGESLDELYQRAVAAKRDALAKRKQIPPFVQKLSR